MAIPSKETQDKSSSQEPLAAELASLRNHFSQPSLFVAGMPPGIRTGLDSQSNGEPLVDRRSPLALDNAFVQQTKDQIRSVVESIASLTHAPIAPSDFVQSVLPKIASAMGASGAALWEQHSDANWRLLSQFNLPSALMDRSATGSPSAVSEASVSSSFEQLDFLETQFKQAAQDTSTQEDSIAVAQMPTLPSTSHLAILNAVARERQPILIPPSDVRLDRDRPANPTSDLLIYAPLTIQKGQSSLWLQMVQSPSGGPSSQRGYLRFVAQMADLMSDYFRSHSLRIFERDREYLTLAEQTMNELAVGLSTKLGVAKLMNSIRRYAHAEHAFLLRRKSRAGRWHVVGAAGLTEIDRRAEGVSQVEQAARELQAMRPNGGPLSTPDTSEIDDERTPALSCMKRTLAASESQWIKPLIADGNALSISTKSATQLSPRGNDVAVLLTWSGNEKPPSRCLEQSALIARLGLSALQIPWWKSALSATNSGSPSAISKANPATWPTSIKWLVAIVALCAFLSVPVPIQLHAPAILVPQVQQHVYAPMDATVETIFVQDGQSVKVGDPLVQLKSPSLSAEYERAIAQQRQNKQSLEDIDKKDLRGTDLSVLDRITLHGRRKLIASGQATEDREIASLKEQIDSLLLVASVNGVVSTWNVQDSLRDRPVREGQRLLSLHEPESRWILEATLLERDAQESRLAFERGQTQPYATMTSLPQVQLPVNLLSDTLPKIENRMNEASSGGIPTTVFRLRFEVDAKSLPKEIAIAGATARINIPIGRGPIIWALGKDFVYKVWSRIQLWL